MRRFVAPLLALALAASGANAQSRRPAFEKVGVDRFHHFVVISEKTAHDRNSVLAIARDICQGGGNLCLVHFWTSKRTAARRIPMTDDQVNRLVASYMRNLRNGYAELQCYKYGRAGEQCGDA